MILLLAVAGGLPAGVAWSWWRREAYQPPEFRAVWLACLSFLPQLALPHLKLDGLAAACLVLSMLAFLLFAWINRRPAGMRILFAGLLLNLVVIASNQGFMPISPQTAAGLVRNFSSSDFQMGDRFGAKDILLSPEHTRFELLADRYLTLAGLPFRYAFSLGDVLIAAGAFVFLLLPRGPFHSGNQIMEVS